MFYPWPINSLLAFYHENKLEKGNTQEALRAVTFFEKQGSAGADSPVGKALFSRPDIRKEVARTIGLDISIPKIIKERLYHISKDDKNALRMAKETVAELDTIDSAWLMRESVVKILPAIFEGHGNGEARVFILQRIFSQLGVDLLVDAFLSNRVNAFFLVTICIYCDEQLFDSTCMLICRIAESQVSQEIQRNIAHAIEMLWKNFDTKVPSDLSDVYSVIFFEQMRYGLQKLKNFCFSSKKDGRSEYGKDKQYYKLQSELPSPKPEIARQNCNVIRSYKLAHAIMYGGLSKEPIQQIAELPNDIFHSISDIADGICKLPVGHTLSELFNIRTPTQNIESLSGLLERASQGHFGSRLVLVDILPAVLEADSVVWLSPELYSLVIDRYLPQVEYDKHFFKTNVVTLSDQIPLAAKQSFLNVIDNAKLFNGMPFGGVRSFSSNFRFDGLEDSKIHLFPWI